MIEGAGNGEFGRVRRLLYARPELLHRVLAVNAEAVAACLVEQVRNGADALMIFDTWGGLLTSQAYRTFSLAYIEQTLEALRQRFAPPVPVVVFTRGGGQWLERIADSGCAAIALDWTTDIGAARARVGHRVALQGNLDPQVLLATPDAVVREARAILAAAGPEPGHVFNLGHGVLPGTPPDNVAALVECVRTESRAQRSAARP
jgi:uroporphyrinogen decarboxylase